MTLVWGVNYVAVKIGMRYFPPLLFGALRIELVALSLLPVWLMRGPRLDRATLLRVALPGLAGMGLNQMTFLYGIKNTSVAHAAFLFMTMPMQVLVLAWLRGQERLRARKLAGMAVALAGVLWLQLAPGKSSGPASLKGDLIILLSGLSFAVFAVWGKEFTTQLGGLAVTTVGHLASSLVLIPVTVYAGWSFPWREVPVAGWLVLAYMVLFPSIVAFMIFHYALKRIAASRVTSFTFLQPLIATSSALALLGEPVSASLFGGGALILAGVYFVLRG